MRASGTVIGLLSAIMGIGGGADLEPVFSPFMVWRSTGAISTSAGVGVLIAVPGTVWLCPSCRQRARVCRRKTPARGGGTRAFFFFFPVLFPRPRRPPAPPFLSLPPAFFFWDHTPKNPHC